MWDFLKVLRNHLDSCLNYWDYVDMYSRPLVIQPSFIGKMTVLLEYFGYRCAFY